MTTPARDWSDSEVQAFVDGELDAEEAAGFAAQVRLDLALAQRVARERALRAKLAGTFASVLREPIPERLTRAVEGKVSSRTTRRAAPGPLWWSAAAAGLLVAWMIGSRMPRTVEGTLVSDDSGLRAGGMLAEALSQRLSAEGSKAQGVLISLSFKAGDGRYCRTFSLDSGIDGLACRRADAWRVEATGRSPTEGAPADDTYRQASSELSPAVMAAISRWRAGDALTREEERLARDSGWR
jgi:hypothetical protein